MRSDLHADDQLVAKLVHVLHDPVRLDLPGQISDDLMDVEG